MFEKKDPGKFTVRFNIADPQQRTVIEVLNQQGRYKAQFLTSAVLHYTKEIQSVAAVSSEEIERIVRSVLAQQQASPPQALYQEVCPAIEHDQPSARQTEEADRDSIFKTLEAFQRQ